MTGTPVVTWTDPTSGYTVAVGDVVHLRHQAFKWRVRAITVRPSGSVDVYVVAAGKTTRAARSGVRVFAAGDLVVDHGRRAAL